MNSWQLKVVVAVAIIVAAVALVYFTTPPGEGQGQSENVNYNTTASGLKIGDIKVGDGQEAKTGDTVAVHYTGWLKDGTKFDSSRDRGKPLPFTLGAHEVIAGWDEGVVGMKVGGKRKLIIPPELAYGSQDKGKIPPNSELTFEVELLSIDK
jgi:FKBP-type peptidyl-prolyl cis-trans isomerase FkpA